MIKRYCPIIRDNCMGDKCQMWVLDGQKVIKRKTHKTGIKDTSNCTFTKLGEYAVMQMWQETERIINQEGIK